MENLKKELNTNTEETKESYIAPTLTKHDNLRTLTKDVISNDYSGDVPVPPPPPLG